MTLLVFLALVFGGCGSDQADKTDDSAPSCATENEECGPGSCEGEGENMLPGSECTACHREGGESVAFGVAGTLFSDLDGSGPVASAVVEITDATGEVFTMTTTTAGNFYTEETPVFPIQAAVEAESKRSAMFLEVETGGCNDCHRCEGPPGGKLYAP